MFKTDSEVCKLQLKVLMGVTADVDIEIADNLGNYETELFANELNQPADVI